MIAEPEDSSTPDPLSPKAQAASWVWRMDRGLSPAEQDAFFEWLAAHPDHAAAVRRYRQNWKRLDLLADWRPEHSRKPNPDLLAPAQPVQRRRVFVAFALAAAACVAVGVGLWPHSAPAPVESPLPLHENRQFLADGSTMKLNTGAHVTELFTASERRIRIEKGEAFFMVIKDASRPFVVEANGVEVRAVGTAFNVRLDASRVDVLVAEGSVAVSSDHTTESGFAPGSGETVLHSNQLMRVPFSADEPVVRVETLDKSRIRENLAWQHGLMTFHERPLSEIVQELNRLNDPQLILMDEWMASAPFSGTIRSDNMDGFARLLQVGFGARIEKSAAGEIRLYAENSSN